MDPIHSVVTGKVIPIEFLGVFLIPGPDIFLRCLLPPYPWQLQIFTQGHLAISPILPHISQFYFLSTLLTNSLFPSASYNYFYHPF